MKFLRAALFYIILMTWIPGLLLADTRGKIAGIVLNQDTGKPLADVEITILNAPLKAWTDNSGHYFILNLPPGIYALRAFYLGFVPVIVEDVFVTSDHTTQVNFKLSETIIELGKTIVEKQGKPTIKKNSSTSVDEFAPIDLKKYPLETFHDILKYLPEASPDARNNFHLRGGRANEIQYFIDGIPHNEPFENRFVFDVLVDEIHEMRLNSGAFLAEYGNAGSGVIQVLNKPIPKNYSGAFAFQTGDILTTHNDIYTEKIKTFNGINNLKFQGKLGGPIPKVLKGKLFFMLSTRYWSDDGYLYGQDKFTTMGNVKSATPDYLSLNPYQSFNLNSTILYEHTANLKLEYKSYYHFEKWRSYADLADHQQRFIPDGKTWNYNQGNSHLLKLSHQISNRLYYTFVNGYFWNKNWEYAFDKIDTTNYLWSGLLQKDQMDEFYIRGTDNYRMSENGNNLISRFDMTAQLGYLHLLRLGLEYKRQDVTFHQYFVDADYQNRDQNRDGIPGNIIINPDSLDNAYRHHPFEIGFYLQDRIEWQSIILNGGLRFDYFSPDAEFATNWNRPAVDSVQNASKKMAVSPRISVAYNFAKQGKIFASYGHFYQLPPYWGLYSNPAYQIYTSRYLPNVGNGDLTLQKTIGYEIGLEQILEYDLGLRIKWFYRDFRDMVGQRIYVTPNGQNYYSVWDACDFGFSQGMMIRVSKTFFSKLITEFDYTYQSTKMNNSQPDPNEKIAPYGLDKFIEPSLFIADWNQPHTFQFHFSWQQPENWGAALHGKIASGYPYTQKSYDPIKDTARLNTGQGPLQLDLDLVAYKTFPIWLGSKKTGLTFDLKIYNLLDRLNEKTVWPSSGTSTHPIELVQQQMSAEWMNRPFWYGKPREILLGLHYDF